MISNIISGLILILFFYGRSLHKTNVPLHISLMWTVMFLDLSLVAYLAFFRDALDKVYRDMSYLLSIHLCFALSTVVLYFCLAYFGIQLSKGRDKFRPTMRRLDKTMVLTRIFTLLTSIALALGT